MYYIPNGRVKDEINESGSDVSGRGYGVRPDIMSVWEELDEARTTLSHIDSIITDFEQAKVDQQQQHQQRKINYELLLFIL